MFIVTGGAGFIGSAIVWKLNQLGIDEIVIVDNFRDTLKWKNLVNLRYIDFISKEYFKQYIDKRFDPWTGIEKTIIHMGACSSTTETDGDYLMYNNYHYTRELALWALGTGSRFITASSAATYGDGTNGFSDTSIEGLKPLNMYAYTKQLFDIWMHRQGVEDKIVSLKFFNVFGPNEYHKDKMLSVPYRAFHQARNNRQIKLFKSNTDSIKDGCQRRDFIYIKDAVDVVKFFIENHDINGVYNVGTGVANTFNDLANSVFKALDMNPSISYEYMPPTLSPNYQNYTCADMTKLQSVGYDMSRFHSLENAIHDYIVNYLLKKDPYLVP